MYRMQGMGQDIAPLPKSNPYCENVLTGMCAKTQSVIDKAKEECAAIERRSQTRGVGLFGGLGRVCTLYESDRKVSMSTYNLWDPCMLAKLSLCGPDSPPQSFVPELPQTPIEDNPPPSDDEGDDGEQTMYMVGGILGLLVLGGVGYAVFKNRKKRKKK